jgi:3-hydroxyacyl-[acyl-carrier-protein] dehydratase
MSVPIVVPGDGPLFAGHFPGRPILPGIAELVLIARALEPSGDAANVSAIPFARFRGLVLPADRLEVEAVPRGDDGVRFEARRSGEVVANGAMMFGGPAVDDTGAMAVASRAVRGAPALDALIPHRPPMRFVERILGEADDGATCLGRVPADCALVTRGATPAFVALEAAAQTAATWEALRRSRGAGAPSVRMGYLVSLKDAVFYQRSIPAEAELIVTVRLLAGAGALTTYAADVSVFGECALRGTIGTYLSD